MTVERRSTGFLLIFALANAGGVIGYLPLLTLLLPLKITATAGDDRLGLLTATVIAGAVAASLANIAFGWLSDRSVAHGGGRRRWMTGGLVATALAYALMARAASPSMVLLAIILFQIALNAVLAPLMAILADEIPDAQRGLASGLLALGNPIASALATILMGMAMLDPATRFLIVPLAIAAFVVPLLLTPARAAAANAATERPRHRGLALAWSGRLLVQVAGTVLFAYLLYYFESIVPIAEQEGVAAKVGTVLTIACILPMPFAVLIGRLSDRTGRRKPFLLAASAVAAAGLIGMAMASAWHTAVIAFCVYSIGSLVFLSLHSGFAILLLPSASHRGRDLGLLNLTNTLPALIGPILTWLLAAPRDFDAVLLTLAALALAGGMLTILSPGAR